MPSRIGPAGTVRVAVQGTHAGGNIVNVMACKLGVTGTPSQTDLDTWTTNFANAFKTAFTTVLNTLYVFTSAQATYFVDGTAVNVLKSVRPLTGSGSGGSNEQRSLAAVISLNSAAYWRGGKPRIYLDAPAGKTSAVNGGQWDSAYLTSLGTAGNAFITAVNGLAAVGGITATQLGFVSYFSGSAPRTPPLFFPVTSAIAHPRLGHQRRRDGKWVA